MRTTLNTQLLTRALVRWEDVLCSEKNWFVSYFFFICFVPACSFRISWLCCWRRRETNQFFFPRVYLTMGVSPIVPVLSECRSQALSTGLPVTTAPIMPHRLPVCTQNSELDTVTGGRRRRQCKFKDSLGVCVCVDFCGEGSSAFGLIGDALLVRFGGPYSGPYLASYRARMVLQRPQSFRSSATCCRSAAFSRSRKEARTVIWFSFSRRASRERFAATLFFFLLDQYFSSWVRGIQTELIWQEGSGRAGRNHRRL